MRFALTTAQLDRQLATGYARGSTLELQAHSIRGLAGLGLARSAGLHHGGSSAEVVGVGELGHRGLEGCYDRLDKTLHVRVSEPVGIRWGLVLLLGLLDQPAAVIIVAVCVRGGHGNSFCVNGLGTCLTLLCGVGVYSQGHSTTPIQEGAGAGSRSGMG